VPNVTREEIETEILAWMRDEDWTRDEARFDRLARTLFAFQVAHCPAYARYCERRGRGPAQVASWREIPAVPTGAFKELVLRCFPAERTVKTFRTSGTATARRGELHLDTLALYEASLLPTLRRFLFPELAPGARTTLRILAPSPAEAPDSSLSHMFGCAVAALGDSDSGFDWARGSLQVEPLLARLDAFACEGRAVALCGTAFAFVHLLDELARRGRRLRLPESSRIMETGGFKGRSRELAPGELYAALGDRLGVPPARIVNQYGMTELGSQFYDSLLREPEAPRRKLGPPWARVRLVDPETGEEVAPGEVGMVEIVDLANTGSVAAVQTADLGRAVGDGFQVLGRAPGAEARGCSIAADAMLAEAR
jgi:hypothetical protein